MSGLLNGENESVCNGSRKRESEGESERLHGVYRPNGNERRGEGGTGRDRGVSGSDARRKDSVQRTAGTTTRTGSGQDACGGPQARATDHIVFACLEII